MEAVQSEEKEAKPPVGAMVLVKVKNYQCLAFYDEQGIWRNFFKKSEITEPVIHWQQV